MRRLKIVMIGSTCGAGIALAAAILMLAGRKAVIGIFIDPSSRGFG